MFNNLATDSNIKGGDKDTLGGNRIFDSDIYKATIAMAYAEKSKGGALGIFLTFKLEDGREFRNTQYVTSGDDKGNKPYYEKDGEKHYLPGFNLINSLCQLTIDRELSTIEPEEKAIKVYDFEAKAEVTKKKPVLTDLLNKPVYIGVLKVTVDKNVKDDSGKYVPSGETREDNEIDKFFCGHEGHERKTTTELKAKTETAEFADKWLEKNKGQVINKAKGAAAGGAAGAPKTGAAGKPAGGKPASSLFS